MDWTKFAEIFNPRKKKKDETVYSTGRIPINLPPSPEVTYSTGKMPINLPALRNSPSPPIVNYARTVNPVLKPPAVNYNRISKPVIQPEVNYNRVVKPVIQNNPTPTPNKQLVPDNVDVVNNIPQNLPPKAEGLNVNRIAQLLGAMGYAVAPRSPMGRAGAAVSEFARQQELARIARERLASQQAFQKGLAESGYQHGEKMFGLGANLKKTMQEKELGALKERQKTSIGAKEKMLGEEWGYRSKENTLARQAAAERQNKSLQVKQDIAKHNLDFLKKKAKRINALEQDKLNYAIAKFDWDKQHNNQMDEDKFVEAITPSWVVAPKVRTLYRMRKKGAEIVWATIKDGDKTKKILTYKLNGRRYDSVGREIK